MTGSRRRFLELGAIAALLAACTSDHPSTPTAVRVTPIDPTELVAGSARIGQTTSFVPVPLHEASITAAPTFVFGDYFNRTVAASELTSLGYPVSTAVALPMDLTPYEVIWHVGAFVALTPAEITRLQAFLAAGGGLFLTGERPCCEIMNASIQTLVNSVVVGGGVTVGGLGDAFTGPYSYNPTAFGGITSTPNALVNWNPSAPGKMAGVSGVNILAKHSSGVVAAVWGEPHLVGNSGRMVVMMDVNWFTGGGVVPGQMTNIQEYLANATGGVPADVTPPSITANVTGTLGDNGWYTSNVGVSWTVEDDESAVTSTTGCDASSVTTNTAGITFTCTATSSGGTASESVTIKRDATSPTVTFSGNLGTYTIDQTLSISCAASDDLSGIASTSACSDISGPAYTFPLGTSTVAALATDNAGNVGSGGTVYTIVVTPVSLCALTRSLVPHNGIANSLCAKLNAAEASAARGNTNAMKNQLGAYVNEVSAQNGKAITAANAAILTALANAMM